MKHLVKILVVGVIVLAFVVNFSVNLNAKNETNFHLSSGTNMAMANDMCHWNQSAGMCFCEITGLTCLGVENCSSISIRCPWE
jgi:hypothetical protein